MEQLKGKLESSVAVYGLRFKGLSVSRLCEACGIRLTYLGCDGRIRRLAWGRQERRGRRRRLRNGAADRRHTLITHNTQTNNQSRSTPSRASARACPRRRR